MGSYTAMHTVKKITHYKDAGESLAHHRLWGDDAGQKISNMPLRT